MNQSDIDAILAQKQKEYHDQFELVVTPEGYRARHKITGQSYQAYDISCAQQNLTGHESCSLMALPSLPLPDEVGAFFSEYS
jgi:hypothetical protein